MKAPVKIVERFATSVDAARLLGVPEKQRKELEKMADDLLARRSRNGRAVSKATTNAARETRRVSRSRKYVADANRKGKRSAG